MTDGIVVCYAQEREREREKEERERERERERGEPERRARERERVVIMCKQRPNYAVITQRSSGQHSHDIIQSNAFFPFTSRPTTIDDLVGNFKFRSFETIILSPAGG